MGGGARRPRRACGGCRCREASSCKRLGQVSYSEKLGLVEEDVHRVGQEAEMESGEGEADVSEPSLIGVMIEVEE